MVRCRKTLNHVGPVNLSSPFLISRAKSFREWPYGNGVASPEKKFHMFAVAGFTSQGRSYIVL